MTSAGPEIQRTLHELPFEQVTAADLLHAICFRAAQDPKNFTADVVHETLVTLGYGEIWDQAAEQVLMVALEDKDEPEGGEVDVEELPTDAAGRPPFDQTDGDEEETEPGLGAAEE